EISWIFTQNRTILLMPTNTPAAYMTLSVTLVVAIAHLSVFAILVFLIFRALEQHRNRMSERTRKMQKSITMRLPIQVSSS
ncbi:hypothetical protein PMAYCL1PPCAC_04697, partial [Pristionchus mayeri]